MSSILGQSSTTDAIEMSSTHDRYSVIHGNRRSKDGEESNNNSASFRHLSIASKPSSDSGTYGTSDVSDGSETLDRDDFFNDEEFGDLDNLSLDSQPMVMDRWVDSACSCLDHPVVLYQSMCLGRETSLLRQSKGISRSTIYHNTATSTNLNISAAKQQNPRLKDKAIHINCDTNDAESAMDDAKKNEIQIMRIQPEEDFEFKDIEGSEKKRNNSQKPIKKERQELVATDVIKNDNGFRLEPTTMSEYRPEESHEKKHIIEKKKTNEEAQSISNASAKSMLERAIQKAAKEDEERDVHAQLSEAYKDVDVKIDPPSDTQIAATRKGQPADSYLANHPNLELSACSRPSEIVSKKDEKVMEVAEDPSGRGQRTPSPNVIASRRSNRVSGTQEIEIPSSDEQSLSNSVEIIDVLSMDDQDSWIPGSRNDIDYSISKNRDNLHQDSQNSPRSNDRSNTLSDLSSSKIHDQQDDRPITADSSNVDDLWTEEAAKLNMGTSSNGATSSRSKGIAAAQSAEDLWNEERMKLQNISDDIFDDPKAREAFLGHRQGRLRDAGIDSSSSNIMRSQSRRQKVQNVLKGRSREDFLTKQSKRNSRSKSLGRNRPSPEIISVIEQSTSESRERNLASKLIPIQQVSGDPLNVTPLSSRKKDLVAVRSIEEGQRIRSSKRDATKYNAVSHRKSSAHAPIDVHNYAGESFSRGPYDERSNSSHLKPKKDVFIKSSSRQRSKSRDPIGTKGLPNVENPAKKHLLSDERDDQESLPSINPIESRPTAATIEKNWSGYDTAISATKELRKLEKKIERQLRRADLDSQTDQSKEIRRMEKNLSKKLRSVNSDDLDAQTMSSREIRRLEKQLAQKLSGENENRASKLKRIKRKGVSSARGLVPLSSKLKEERQHLAQEPSSHSGQNNHERSPDYVTTPSYEDQDNRPDKSRYENSKGLRSRYVRRGIGRRNYSRVPGD